MATQGGLIQFVCIAATHVSSKGTSSSDTLTVVSGRWAYCPFNALGDGHDWRETEGVTIEALRSGLPHGKLGQLAAEQRRG